MGTAYSPRNKAEREHLQKVVSRLSETLMTRPAAKAGP